MHCQTNAIADARGEDPAPITCRRKGEHDGTVLLNTLSCTPSCAEPSFSLPTLEVTSTVGKANDAIIFSDIDPLWFGPGGIECDAEWTAKPVGIDLVLICDLALCARPQNTNASRRRFGHEQIAGWRAADDAGSMEPCSEKVNAETLRRLRPEVGGAGHDARRVA
jgi:hypothetical protein